MGSAGQIRRHPRFEVRHQAEVRIGGQGQIVKLWTHDVSRGGLFLEMEEPLPIGSTLEVARSGDASLNVRAAVAHVLAREEAKRLGMPPGIGTEFIDLSPAQEAAIGAYIDRIEAALNDRGPATEGSLEDALNAARVLLDGVNREDLYAALGVAPTVSSEKLSARVSELLRLFTQPVKGGTPPQLTRIEVARKQLEKVATLATDEERRLDYDLRHGLLRVTERTAASRAGGMPMERLRRVWTRVFAERVSQSKFHLTEAARFERARAWEGALAAGLKANELDPFNEEILKSIDFWRKKRGAQLSAARED
jgi:hypothetical protein